MALQRVEEEWARRMGAEDKLLQRNNRKQFTKIGKIKTTRESLPEFL